MFLFPQEDRSRQSRPCTDSDDPEFEEKFGLPKTRFNCQILQAHYLVPNCSMLLFSGVKNGEDQNASRTRSWLAIHRVENPCFSRTHAPIFFLSPISSCSGQPPPVRAGRRTGAAVQPEPGDGDRRRSDRPDQLPLRLQARLLRHAHHRGQVRPLVHRQALRVRPALPGVQRRVRDTVYYKTTDLALPQKKNFFLPPSRKSILLQFYFESFDYPENTMSEETFLEFVCTILYLA